MAFDQAAYLKEYRKRPEVRERRRLHWTDPEQVAKNRVRHEEYRMRNREFLRAYLASHPCVDCGESDPVVLHFDHVRGKKFRTVGVLVARPASVKTIEKEIAKCDVVCANCHMRRTAVQQKWKKRNW